MRVRATLIASAGLLGAAAVVAAAVGMRSEATEPAPPTEGGAAVATFASQNYECPRYTIMDPAEAPRHQFYFTRGQYSNYRRGGFRGNRRGGGGSWATDFEKADRQFLVVLRHYIDIDAFPCENTVSFDDPAVFRFPYIYILEVGSIGMTDEEAAGMREWMLRGGFLHVDDFWGIEEWRPFQEEMRRVFPEYDLVELSPEAVNKHEIFNSVYNVQKVEQVPNVNNGCSGGRYWENPSDTEPRIFGMFHETGRLMMIVTYNSDLGDAWEWAERACYPVDRSTWAFQMGVNFIVYAMSH